MLKIIVAAFIALAFSTSPVVRNFSTSPVDTIHFPGENHFKNVRQLSAFCLCRGHQQMLLR